MAVKLKKKQGKKITPRVQTETSSIDAQRVATQYKKLEAELKEIAVDPVLKKKQDKLATLKKQMVEYANTNAEDDEILEFITKHGDMTVGKRGTSRSLTDKDKAIELMGMETFIKLSEPKLSDLDKYLTPEEIEQITVTKVTNTRRIT